jgi:hypothetical protein
LTLGLLVGGQETAFFFWAVDYSVAGQVLEGNVEFFFLHIFLPS